MAAMGEDAPQSLHWHEHWSALVLDQEHKKFCWRGIACVPTNNMNIVGALIKSLSWRKRDLSSALDLHHYGTLQNVYKCMGIVTVNRVRSAGWILPLLSNFDFTSLYG